MLLVSPSNVGVPRLCVGVRPCCLPCGLVEWREGGVCVVPVFGLVLPFHIALVPPVLSYSFFALSSPLPLFVFAVTALLV